MTTQRIFEVIFIRAPASAVWDALTNPDITQRYWFDTRIESDWRVGSKVRYVCNGEVTDEHIVLAADPPRRLSHTFKPLFGEFQFEPPSKLTFMLEENGGVVRLTVVHEDFPPDSRVFRACSEGWPAILSNLKTLLETGTPLPDFTFPPQTARFG